MMMMVVVMMLLMIVTVDDIYNPCTTPKDPKLWELCYIPNYE